MNVLLEREDFPDVKNDFLVIFKDKKTGRLIKFGWCNHKAVALDQVLTGQAPPKDAA
jgi:hypothetical protein